MSDQQGAGAGSPERIARAWLQRNVVQDGHEPELDEGDCTVCGTAAGEPHEPTDVCGIIANLLAQLAQVQAERDEARAALTAQVVDLSARVETLTQERDCFRSALSRHLCEHDMADWVGCLFDHQEHCSVCEHDKPREHQLLARAEAAEAEVARLRALSEWQPIATAPNGYDGKRFHYVLFRGTSKGMSFAGYAYVSGYMGSDRKPVHSYGYKLNITDWREIDPPVPASSQE